MTEIPISPEIWKLAGEILTERQLAVLTLREKHGYSWHQICVTLNIRKATAREHYQAATANVYNALNGSTPKPRPTSEKELA